MLYRPERRSPAGDVPVDDATHQTDTGLGRRFGLIGGSRSVHCLRILIAHLLCGWTPRVEREFRQHGEVGAPSGHFCQARIETRDSIGLVENFTDQRRP